MKFEEITGVIADMDGVMWRGDTPIPGMETFFKLMDDSGLPFMLATNNTARTPEQYVQKLAKFGINTITPENIVTSGTATVDYLLREYPMGADVYVFGPDSLRQLVADAGFPIVERDAEVVVAGLNRDNLNYETFKAAALQIRAGARFVATNPDRTFPTPEGLAPGTGSMVAALVAATDREPDAVCGKPYPPMYEVAVARMGSTPATTLMIGDRIDTDIAGAQKLGMKTALVLTGVTSPDGLVSSDTQPDVAYEDIGALVKAWNYTGGKRKR